MAFFSTKKTDSVRIKTYIFPLVLVSLILLSFSFIIRPRLEAISEKIENNANNRNKLVKLTEKLSLLEGLNESDLTQRSELVKKALPENKDPISIMSLLKQLASETGVSLTKIDVKPGKLATSSGEKIRDRVPVISFSLSLGGSFDQLDSLIQKLTKTFPVIRMEKVSFRSSTEVDYLDLKTEIYTYYLSFPTSFGKIDSPVLLITDKERQICDNLESFSSPSTLTEPVTLSPIESETGRINPFF